MPESEKIEDDQENTWLNTSYFQPVKQMQRKNKARKKELTKISFDKLEPYTVLAQKIEQMKKMVRTHRAALDFNRSFCRVATAVEFDEQVYHNCLLIYHAFLKNNPSYS